MSIQRGVLLPPLTLYLSDQMNPVPRAIRDTLQRRYALASARLPLKEPDRCPEDLLNRIIWQAQKGSRVAYPTWAVTVVEDD